MSRPSYALTQWFRPRAEVELPDRLKLPPVLSLLGVRYLIFRGEPQPTIRRNVGQYSTRQYQEAHAIVPGRPRATLKHRQRRSGRGVHRRSINLKRGWNARLISARHHIGDI